MSGRAYATSRVYAVRRNPEGDQITRTPRDIALALPLDETKPGELRKYVITLHYLPPSKNEWRSWDGPRKAGTKRRWIQAIVRECEAQNMPKGLPVIGLYAELTFPSRGVKRDPQNYAATLWEFVPDALENKQHGSIKRMRNGQEYREPLWGYGMIEDDSEGHIEWGPNHSIGFRYDERRGIPAKMRRRTRIHIGVRMPR